MFIEEKFSLTIPWMNLSRRPSEIHLQGLYLLIVPKNGKRDEKRGEEKMKMRFVEMERDEREHQMNKMRKVQKKVEEMKRVILGMKQIFSTETNAMFI